MNDELKERINHMNYIRHCAMDSLDRIRKEDLEPIASEYPRRDNIYYSELQNIHDTFLYKLTCKNNEALMKFLFNVPEKVQNSKAESEEAWNNYSQQRHRRKEAILAKLRPLIAEIKANKKKKKTANVQNGAKKKNPRVKSLAALMIDPTIKHYNTYTIMPVQVTYNNANIKKKYENDVGKFNSNSFQSTSGVKPKVNTRWLDDPHFDKFTNKKLITNKYRRTISQNLIKYVANQKTLYNDLEKSSSTQTIFSKNKNLLLSAKPSERPFDKMALLNKKYLGKDISRVVSAIEEKIVHVLAEPDDSNAAFNEIEREIKDIISVMQRMKEDDVGVIDNKLTFVLSTLDSEESLERNSEESRTSKKSGYSFKTVRSNISSTNTKLDTELPRDEYNIFEPCARDTVSYDLSKQK